MLTIEIRVNGQLVEAVNVRNIGSVPGDTGHRYSVARLYSVREYEVSHCQADGALVLAAKALEKYLR